MGLELCPRHSRTLPGLAHRGRRWRRRGILKDYPIEENHELTIRSVIDNLMLYQEGWGVGRIKHSLTYSGGLSRSYVQQHAPGADMASPASVRMRSRRVIEVAEGIPFGPDRLRRAEPLRAQGRDREPRRQGHHGSTCRLLPKRRFQPRDPGRRHAYGWGNRADVSPGVPQSTRNAVMSPTRRRLLRDRFILERRPPRAVHENAWRAHGVTDEEERSADESVARVATVFLTGRECPWRCVMCDLWRRTESDTPRGAIAAQVAAAQSALDQSGDPVTQIKLLP